eukprot:CAMPEP_0206533890 /NCGR_PEP_ID=MMETSP0325_2-20121206/5231_1 /ASSEMBLY_ACC=CAM_ASM_000347 /TAXON_ID=2866 /ORGANISM="Crypthecodinium cohnii, Strain Seligo" /LENGTH=382 /DNA_ID=CAMNT_0054030613 /DNA_START=315 /DNA_END=1460 /DNA_ORIENTATION=-
MKDSPCGPIASLLAQEASLRARRRQQSAAAAVRTRPPAAEKAKIEPWAAGRRKSVGDAANKSSRPPSRAEASKAARAPAADFEDISTSAASDGDLHEKDSKQVNAVWDAFHQRNSAFVEEKETIISIMRQQKEAAEMEECTFQPVISNTNEHPFAQPSMRRGSLSLYERSLEDQLKKEQRLHKMREQQLQEEMQECSFQPQRRRQRAATPTRQVPSTPSSASSRGPSGPGSYLQQFRPMSRPVPDHHPRSRALPRDSHHFEELMHEREKHPMPPFLTEDPRHHPSHQREEEHPTTTTSSWQAPFGSQWADDSQSVSHAQRWQPRDQTSTSTSRVSRPPPPPSSFGCADLPSAPAPPSLHDQDLAAPEFTDFSGAAGAAVQAW